MEGHHATIRTKVQNPRQIGVATGTAGAVQDEEKKE
jgi:hypothetical protein